MSRMSDIRKTYDRLNARPLMRALMHQVGLALLAAVIVGIIGLPFGAGVSALAVLLIHMVLNAGLAARHMREPPDPETVALEAFADEPLGALIGGAKEQLVRSRREIGRDATMHRSLDRLVRATRTLERRLALDAKLRPELNRAVTRELPLVASTAEQYVRMLARGEESERLVTVEGVLREAVERMEGLASAKGRGEGAMIGMVRLDADAEVLADYLATDTGAAAERASVMRLSHRLERAGRAMVPELEEKARSVAGLLEAGAALPAVSALCKAEGARLLALAETPEMDVGTRAALRKMLIDWRETLGETDMKEMA